MKTTHRLSLVLCTLAKPLDCCHQLALPCWWFLLTCFQRWGIQPQHLSGHKSPVGPEEKKPQCHANHTYSGGSWFHKVWSLSPQAKQSNSSNSGRQATSNKRACWNISLETAARPTKGLGSLGNNQIKSDYQEKQATVGSWTTFLLSKISALKMICISFFKWGELGFWIYNATKEEESAKRWNLSIRKLVLFFSVVFSFAAVQQCFPLLFCRKGFIFATFQVSDFKGLI